MNNYLVVSALAPRESGAIKLLTGKILETGCNLVECRVANLGGSLGVLLLASGGWDAVAKLESALPKFEQENGIALQFVRTEEGELSGEQTPYAVDIVAADRPGIVHSTVEFFAARGIQVDQLACSRYKATLTGAPMFSGHLSVLIPLDLHIAALRDEFMEFCDRLNLDAILEPVKT